MAKIREQEFSYDEEGILLRSPTYAIEVALAINTFFLGVYCLTPFYRPTVATDYAYTFQTNYGVRALTALLLFFLPSIITMLSLFSWKLKSNKWRRRATFNQVCGWSFLTASSLFNLGFYPVSWTYSFTLAVVAGICHLNRRAIIGLSDG